MRRWLSLFLMILIYVSVATAWAQDNGQTVASVNGEYIKEWLVLGPFFSDDLEMDFLANAGGEANIDPREGDTVTTAESKALTWQRYTAKGNIIDLLDAVGQHDNAIAYAFCILESDAASDAQVYLGSDDGAVVWMNGKRVHQYDELHSLALDEDVFDVSLTGGNNSCLVKVYNQTADWAFAARAAILPANRAVLSGTITDATGQPMPDVPVRLEEDGLDIAQTRTDGSGYYRMNVYPVHGLYDLAATAGDLGDWQLSIRLREGERQQLNLTLKEAINIEGTLLMLDDMTPHVAVPVQAIRSGKVASTAFSDERGKYRLINLKPGRYQVRCQVMGGYVYYGEEEAGNGTDKPISLQVEHGKTLKNTDFHIAAFKDGMWRKYSFLDGLTSTTVYAIHRGADGALWLGTPGGVYRYDGKEFVNFTVRDGLAVAKGRVGCIYSDSDGVMWFGTSVQGSGFHGVSRYDGKTFVNFTTKDGLAGNAVRSIYCDTDGVMWLGTNGSLCRYDDKRIVSLGQKDVLADNIVYSIHEAPNGMLWFGTTAGAFRYDRKEFINFTTKDGLVHNKVGAIHRDTDGVIWLGTDNGLSRYDGEKFVNFTTEDGLPHNLVLSIHGCCKLTCAFHRNMIL